MGRLAICAALGGLLGGLSVASPAAADRPAVRRHGEACPPTGCAGARRSSLADSLGFASVVLATGWIARRGAADSR